MVCSLGYRQKGLFVTQQSEATSTGGDHSWQQDRQCNWSFYNHCLMNETYLNKILFQVMTLVLLAQTHSSCVEKSPGCCGVQEYHSQCCWLYCVKWLQNVDDIGTLH